LNEPSKVTRVSDVDVVVTISQVAASKTKIYMVLEFVNGGELFDKIVSSLTTPFMNTVFLHVQLPLLTTTTTTTTTCF
jgi:hypothetical protein